MKKRSLQTQIANNGLDASPHLQSSLWTSPTKDFGDLRQHGTSEKGISHNYPKDYGTMLMPHCKVACHTCHHDSSTLVGYHFNIFWQFWQFPSMTAAVVPHQMAGPQSLMTHSMYVVFRELGKAKTTPKSNKTIQKTKTTREDKEGNMFLCSFSFESCNLFNANKLTSLEKNFFTRAILPWDICVPFAFCHQC